MVAAKSWHNHHHHQFHLLSGVEEGEEGLQLRHGGSVFSSIKDYVPSRVRWLYSVSMPLLLSFDANNKANLWWGEKDSNN